MFFIKLRYLKKRQNKQLASSDKWLSLLCSYLISHSRKLQSVTGEIADAKLGVFGDRKYKKKSIVSKR